MKSIHILSLFGALIIALFIIYFSVVRSGMNGVSGAFGVDKDSTANDIIVSIIAFSATILGVLLGSLYRRLVELKERGQQSIRNRVLFRQVLRSIDFKIGLVGAPIVFGLLWNAISDISMPGMLIIALQNGFTSHAILREVVPYQTEGQPPTG